MRKCLSKIENTFAANLCIKRYKKCKKVYKKCIISINNNNGTWSMYVLYLSAVIRKTDNDNIFS